ncbi:MAG: tetratricopeptide repeat protein [Chloroflexi bacterium]|nr:tetratricopeptide repeat protein [Chloroflexota bacterium]
MVDAILTTKLYIPSARPQVVSRPRLIDRLTEGLTCKLIVVSAPAGYGKTTLLSQWVGRNEFPAAWVSLDESDNDPQRFLTYVVSALQTIEANMGAGALSLLQSPQPLPTESILNSLINEVAETAQDFILVLDDYHLIEARPIHDALAFLLDRLPPQMHLVMASRTDPPLPLARLRGRGELTELRAAELRFTPDEAAAFLNQVMGLGLSADDIAALETRTEGWIVGLQMAALSMQGRDDTASFIQAFTGSHHFIIDYLVEEVLQRQSERVRSFLLHTSILERLSGPLCDAVTGQEDGRGMLETLERGNLFVVPLDDRRQWYRYHHLFADVLQAHSMEQQPDQAPIRHRRASEWYEQNDLPSDAIHHALAAEDFERAAGLVELAAPAMRRARQDATLLGCLKALPDELVRFRPVLSVEYAAALLATDQLEAVELHLRDAERWLDATVDTGERVPAAEMVVVNEEGFRSLPGMISVVRAHHAQTLGDLPGSVKYARRALDLVPEKDHLGRGAAAAHLGLASWASGDLEAAHRTFANGMASLQTAGHIADAISGTLILADIRRAQGRLHQAVSNYEHALQLAMKQGEPVPRGTADLYVGMSELHRERGDLETATQHLLKSKEPGERAGLPENRYRWCVAMARIKEAQGDLDGALDLLHEAERLYIRDAVPNVRPIAALKTRIWVAQGRLAEALAWAQEQELTVEDELSYLREFEHITLARLLIAQHSSERKERPIHEAMELLKRLLKAAEEGERTGSVIEILVQQALAHQSQGDTSLALAPLERALTLAEPEGYIRIFVDEGPPIAALLREAAKNGIVPNYISQLLRAFGKAEGRTPVTQLLIEPLSERELEVLRLLGTELNGPEIASQLTVSLNTMRTHTKNIYNKLGVNNRQAAVRRAEELDLL